MRGRLRGRPPDAILGRMLRTRLLALVAILLLAPTAVLATGDPLSGQQWHLPMVGAVDAWEASRGQGIVVAVVDSGVDAGHPDLLGQVMAGRDFVEPGTTPDDPNGHGTVVAGVIAAIAGNGEGGAGVVPRARIMPVRVLDADGRGRARDVADGIRWAVTNGADVVNLSLVEEAGVAAGTLITSEVERAIRQAHDAGIVVVGASGNDGRDATPYAADVPIIVVGATGRDDRAWSRSNGDSRTIYAPGVDIVSTFPGGGYAKADGTSFAAPIVAAGAAMLLEQGYRHDRVATRLSTTAVDIGTGLGRVDLASAVGVLARPSPEPSPAPEPAPEPAPDPEPTPEPVPEPEPVEEPTTPVPTSPVPTPPSTPGLPPGVTPLPVGPDAADPRPRAFGDGGAGSDPQPAWPAGIALALLVANVAGHVAARRIDGPA